MERFLVKKEPKPKAMTVTAQALEKRRAVALPSKLVQLFPVIADFCDTGTLLDWLSCYRPGDEDRRIIEAGFSGSIELPAIRCVGQRTLRRLVPLQVLRALTRTSAMNIHPRSPNGDNDFRVFRCALMNDSLANLETLVIVTDDQPSIVTPFWLDVPPSLKSLRSLKFLRIYAESDFFKDNETTLLTAMASMRSLEDFDVRFAWTSSLVATFLKLKWPALKVLRSDHILMVKPPVPAVPKHEQLLVSAFANGHFPRVSHLIVGESLGGNLFDALPKDGLKQIKTLTLVGRILRSPLLNFRTLPPGELNLNGTGGTIYRSLFSGLECLDVSHLHVPDVMPFFHAADEQAIYCDAFHQNSLRALANLTTVVGASKLKKVMISELFVSDSDKYLAAEQPALERMLECRAEIAAARLSTLTSVVKGIKVLELSQFSSSKNREYRGVEIYRKTPNIAIWMVDDIDDHSFGAAAYSCFYRVRILARFLSECKDLHESVEELVLTSDYADSYRSCLCRLIIHDGLYHHEPSAVELMRNRVEDLERAIADYDSGLDQSCHREDLEQKLERARGILDALERLEMDGCVSSLFPNEGDSRDVLIWSESYPEKYIRRGDCFDRTSLSGFKALRSLVFKLNALRDWDALDEWDDDDEWLDLEFALRLLPPCCTSLTVEKSGLSNRLRVFPSIKELSKPMGKGLITHYFKHVENERKHNIIQLNVTTRGSTQFSTHQLVK